PGYISPEQAQGAALDSRSDIYSLGATFYHLVTGRLPFEAPTPVAMIVKHLNEPLRSPRAVNPAVPYPIASAIQKMMAKRPGERFQDYDALIRELERALAVSQGAAAARPATAAGAPPIPAWSGATGVEGRPARGRPPLPAVAEPPARGISWLPILLVAAVGALLIAGVVQHRRSSATQRRAASGGAAGGATSTPVTESPAIETRGTFSTPPADRPATFPGLDRSADERMRDRFRRRGRANLMFSTNDHEVMPDGRLRVFGEVRNTGGTLAGQGRVRIQILDESGAVVARAETSLQPGAIPPGGSAQYEVPVDYSGPVGTIKAELSWVE
ncbi:MAG: serine/threonine protein kinase, partial [Candidatus Polarisedimenticolia bacterium]